MRQRWASLDIKQKVAVIVGLVAVLGVVGLVLPDTEDPADADTPSSGGPADAGPGLAEQVEAAFAESYDWPDDPAWSNLVGFDDWDAPRVTVVTDLADKTENEETAMGYCRAVTSVSSSVDARFTGVYVTAGEGGAFLAECDAAS
ncbi:hypothetical protein JL108_14480 [Aeromicrobium sp. YIM 150415]|uniref:hypothetical protein n=1 Tax=Aeromicrobium sp. YIM 150415 TaxID=2803912 RepID=UPI001963A5F4|nr:hypothetical protein [Aeromicrobium sp. YIM 150415]MBM9464660.1 hypothetical protein [Aeromicrobium sp. YIM 150415]